MSGAELLTVWDVDENPSYDVRRTSPTQPLLIAIRTHAGRGILELAGGRTFDLAAGTFLVVENERIARYRCATSRWAFWWFEHRVGGPLPCPLYEPIPCPVARDEAAIVSRIMTSLRHPHAAHRIHASALFLGLVTRWSRERPASPGQSRHQATVQKTIDEMHRRLGEGWTVREMAKSATMSERLFRKVFLETTGRSPKQFYDGLRIDAATELLRLGIHSVKEVANRLGFANPFHLSRIYRTKVGVPPSKVRTPETRLQVGRQAERPETGRRASGVRRPHQHFFSHCARRAHPPQSRAQEP